MKLSGLKHLMRTDRARFAIVVALLAMVAVHQLGAGILFALIPVQLAAAGQPAATAGTVASAYSIGFMIGCLAAPQLIRALGIERAPVALALFNGLLSVLYWLHAEPWLWALLRGLAGLSAAAFFILAESALAERTTAEDRGIVFGMYMTLHRAAFAIGQFLLAALPQSNLPLLFLVAALIYVIAPLTRPRAPLGLPPMTRITFASAIELPRLAPAAAAGALLHGMVFAAGPALLPKWGLDVGMPIATVALALFALQIGGLFLQMPISILSDRFERRAIMALVSLATTIGSALLSVVDATNTAITVVALMVWGGVASSLYSLAAAHANDLAGSQRRVAWVSSLMLIWATGAATGPLIASLLMDWKGGASLWIYCTGLSLAGTLFLVWRRIVRP